MCTLNAILSLVFLIPSHSSLVLIHKVQPALYGTSEDGVFSPSLNLHPLTRHSKTMKPAPLVPVHPRPCPPSMKWMALLAGTCVFLQTVALLLSWAPFPAWSWPHWAKSVCSFVFQGSLKPFLLLVPALVSFILYFPHFLSQAFGNRCSQSLLGTATRLQFTSYTMISHCFYMAVLVPGSCLVNHRETGGCSKELECPLASLTLKTVRECVAN
jgi:hypothetical protein